MWECNEWVEMKDKEGQLKDWKLSLQNGQNISVKILLTTAWNRKQRCNNLIEAWIGMKRTVN